MFVLTDATGKRIVYGGTPLLIHRGSLVGEKDHQDIPDYVTVWCGPCANGDADKDIPGGCRLDHLDTPIQFETL